MTIDPVTTEVVASRLRETASTMEYALYHSGYSPILRESKDGTAGITDAAGRVIMISGGLQYHFTAYQQTRPGGAGALSGRKSCVPATASSATIPIDAAARMRPTSSR